MEGKVTGFSIGRRYKMKFLTLFKNELRTASPWILLAVALMILLGGFMIYVEYTWQRERGDIWNENSGAEVHLSSFRQRSSMSAIGPLLFFASIGLGLVLGLIHFLMPFITKT